MKNTEVSLKRRQIDQKSEQIQTYLLTGLKHKEKTTEASWDHEVLVRKVSWVDSSSVLFSLGVNSNKLVIVFTRAAPAFEDLFNTCIWFLLDINTVHTNVKKETFEHLLTSMQLVSIFLSKFDIEIYYSHTVLLCETATYCLYSYVNSWFGRLLKMQKIRDPEMAKRAARRWQNANSWLKCC